MHGQANNTDNQEMSTNNLVDIDDTQFTLSGNEISLGVNIKIAQQRIYNIFRVGQYLNTYVDTSFINVFLNTFIAMYLHIFIAMYLHIFITML